jgi:hypothetical protein
LVAYDVNWQTAVFFRTDFFVFKRSNDADELACFDVKADQVPVLAAVSCDGTRDIMFGVAFQGAVTFGTSDL